MLTAIVLVHDESDCLPKCLQSLDFADEIIAIVDNPTPAVTSILKSAKIRTIHHALNGDFASHRNFALTQISSEWVLFVDADEIVSTQLAQKISFAIQKPEVNGYLIHRVDYMWGHRLKYGDLSSVYLLRLARTNSGIWVGRVHETWQITGQVESIDADLIHTPHPSMADFLHTINSYSSIRARELYDSHITSSIWQIIFFPIAKFIYLWLFRQGIRDGIYGLIHALTMSFYSFLVRGKLYLLNG